MARTEEIKELKRQLDMLGRRRIELATMCRIEQLAEIKERINAIRAKLEGIKAGMVSSS